MELNEKFFKNYKELIIVAVLLIAVIVLSYQPISNIIKKTKNTIDEHNGQILKVNEAKEQVADLEKAKNMLIDKQNKLKPVFEQKGSPEDSIASFGGMFEDIVDYIKINNLMLRTIEYSINPIDDPLYAQFPLLYNVCRVNLMAIGTYSQLEAFLNDIYIYPYFVDITKVEVNPYQSDKKYLLANISITLYSKKQKAATAI